MAALPKAFLTVGASFLSARAATRLVAQADAEPVQKAVFKELIPNLAQGFVWSSLGVEAAMGYDDFRSRVPIQTHADLARHIDSMRRGAEDVLWPGRCVIFARKAGTTPGPPRLIPVTEAMLGHFRKAGIESMLWYTARVRNTEVYRGRHLHLGGSTALEPIGEPGGPEAFAGDLGGIRSLNLPTWAEKHLYEPGTEIAQMTDWTAKLAAVVERTYPLDISLLEGMPNWIVLLAAAIRERAAQEGNAAPNLQAVWPRLECLVHGGVPIAPFQDELHTLLGPKVAFHEVYPAAEGLIAAQDADSAAGLRLMADAGIFFEFLPMADYEPSRIHLLGPKAVPIGGVKAGTDYAVLLTTPAGLARYFIGDVVRFTSTRPPRLLYVGRTELRLNAFGENVAEKEVTDTVVGICRRNGWTIAGFHVAPFFTPSTTGNAPGRHEWWVELHAGTAITPTGPIIAAELDKALIQHNPGYAAKRSSGALEAPYVRLVMPGVFEQWMRHHGKWGGQNKMPRCSSDRAIADELGKALQFAKD